MRDQKLVIEHISESLNSSIEKYQRVFDEYAKLQNQINNANNI